MLIRKFYKPGSCWIGLRLPVRFWLYALGARFRVRPRRVRRILP